MNYSNIFNLENKTAYVLGGSGLIGSEVCKALSAFNCKVINLDIKNFLIQNKKIIFKKFNLQNNFNNTKLLKSLFNKHGNPDIFINCSYPKLKSWNKNNFSNIKYQSFSQHIKIHLNTYAWLARIFAETMKQKKIEGSIIQLTSIYGILGQDLSIYKKTSMKENMTYSIIKGGIISLTKQMASFYGKNKVRVNNICPGGIYEDRKNKKKQNKIFLKNYTNKTPMARLGRASEIANAVIFLSSSASSYITGTTLVVDGGYSII